MDEDFKSLIKSAKKGDRHSFAVLYSRIYKELYRYAMFTLRNQEDAEDCVSEAVIDAYRTIGNLKNEECFKAWFFKILSAKCKRKIKEYYKEPMQTEFSYDNFNDIDIGIDLKTAFFTLSAEDRMIISLTLFGGYNSKEIAKIIKMNSNTVRSRYSRALEKLKAMLAVEHT
ncbi:MAG: RNA polymerase sigma factor [Acutalibacteraceae bacterium]|jgi:RNA polymerase sigma-70 factor (ECF subfamily)|nr:RNA polymerase sigma factor [Acutalibacteraceae bacterium]